MLFCLTEKKTQLTEFFSIVSQLHLLTSKFKIVIKTFCMQINMPVSIEVEECIEFKPKKQSKMKKEHVYVLLIISLVVIVLIVCGTVLVSLHCLKSKTPESKTQPETKTESEPKTTSKPTKACPTVTVRITKTTTTTQMTTTTTDDENPNPIPMNN